MIVITVVMMASDIGFYCFTCFQKVEEGPSRLLVEQSFVWKGRAG